MPCRYPRGVSRPTARGEDEGSGLGVSPGPNPRGTFRPTLGVAQNALRQTPLLADGYCCGQYACYWNAFLFMLQLLLEVGHFFISSV